LLDGAGGLPGKQVGLSSHHDRWRKGIIEEWRKVKHQA
jgi:hypothetical protein